MYRKYNHARTNGGYMNRASIPEIDVKVEITQEWVDLALDQTRENMETALDLQACKNELTERDKQFADDLLKQLYERKTLSEKQWNWVNTLKERVKGSDPIYGSFDAIFVMFKIAASNGKLKRPKVRLLSKDNTFVQLTFFPDRDGKDGKTIEIHTGGWSGHGKRLFAGWIRENCIVPYKPERTPEDVKLVIQELALDPMGCAKAMAKKLSACMYCGKRLADNESKNRGYGPICADNYQLPWKGNTWEYLESKNIKVKPKI